MSVSEVIEVSPKGNTIESVAKTRNAVYAVVFSVLIACAYLLRNIQWQSSAELHTVIETIATLLAFFVGAVALAHYHTNGKIKFLFIGSGFVGTAFLDGYHTIVTSTWFHHLWPSPLPALLSWSWNASRIFLSVLLFLSWVVWKQEDELVGFGKRLEIKVNLVISLLTVSTFFFFAWVPLPTAYSSTIIVGRPEEFISASFFLAALIGYLRKGQWKTDNFEHWMVLSLIVGFTCQIVFMPFSYQLFDGLSDMAIVLKMISYACVLTGLLFSMIELFRRANESAQNLAIVNGNLNAEIHGRKGTEQRLREVKKALINANESLEDRIAARTREIYRYQQILEATTDFVSMTNEDGQVMYLNNAGKKMIGFQNEQESHKLKLADYHPAWLHKKYIEEILPSAVKNGVWTGETVIVTSMGREIPASTVLIAHRDSVGNVEFLSTIARDISKEKHVERALKQAKDNLEQEVLKRTAKLLESESRSRALLEAIPDMMFRLDGQGYVLDFKADRASKLALSPERLLGKRLHEVWPQELADLHFSQMHQALQSKEVVTYPFLMAVNGGEPRHFEARAVLAEGREEVVFVVRDITEGKRAELALKQSRQLLQDIVDNSGAVIYAKEFRCSNGSYLLINRSFEQLIQRQSEDIIGKTDFDLFPHSIAERHGKADSKTYQSGQVLTLEEIGPDGTGEHHYMSVKAPLLDELYEPYAIVSISTEITELKKAEAALKRYASELARSNKELDDFAYVASHDLKEPLRGIHNYAAFLLEDYGGRFDAEGQAKLETLQRLTRRMETLIDSLLYFSRVGRAELMIAETDLNEVIADVTDSLRLLMAENNLTLRLPESLPTIRCDRVRVGEVFQNLIANAMKYNDNDEKWVEVGVDKHATAACGEQVNALESSHNSETSAKAPVFYVRDNGIGIRARHLEQVFRIFKRLHGRDKYGGGSGAGLTITKKIIERHGGRIWVESTYGEGTTFYLTLTEG